MLAKRIIPCLDIDKGRVVKGINFINIRDAGDPVEQASVYDLQGADEVVFLDITASHERRSTVLKLAEGVARTLTVPFAIGGGLRTVDDIRATLRAGADKIAINTAAVENPSLISDGAQAFGAQCIVVAIDARRVPGSNPLSWEVFTHGGRTPTGLDALDWAKRCEELGAGEILLTSMDKDGTRDGFDLELNRAMAEALTLPIIASGGAGNMQHIYEVLTDGMADAALAASIFHFGELTVPEVKRYLADRGVPVRLTEEA